MSKPLLWTIAGVGGRVLLVVVLIAILAIQHIEK